MKKKIAVIALTLASLTTFAFEANVKAGFDFLRNHQAVPVVTGDNKKFIQPGINDGLGFTLGAEIIPLNKGIVELGVGAEYNFGVTKPAYNHGKDFFIPIYALTHLNLARSKDNTSALYIVNRLGGAVIKKTNIATETHHDDTFYGGVYYGVGLGAEVHNFVFELLYDGAYLPQIAKQKEIKFGEQAFQNKLGFKFGLRVGDYKTKAPVVEEVVVKEEPVAPVVVSEPVVVPEPEPVVVPEPEPVVVETPVVETPKEVIITEDNIPEFIHASCNKEEKVCTIFGFKVDGRTPSEDEKKSLGEVVELVNNYAEAGKVVVVGHTDATGSVPYNQKLSVERAKTVAKLLQEYGLKDSIVIEKVTGKGELSPIETNKTKVGRYKNRRVELQFIELETK